MKNNIDSIEYKNAKDFALSGAKLSISLASLCLALLSITSPTISTATNATTKTEILALSLTIRVALIIIGTGLLFSAALLIDWIVDGFPESLWKEVVGADVDIKKFDQFAARAKLYNGGYAFLVSGIAMIGATMLSLAPSHLKDSIANSEMFFYPAAVLFCVYLIFQMMTYSAGKLKYAVLAFLLLVVFILGGIIF